MRATWNELGRVLAVAGALAACDAPGGGGLGAWPDGWGPDAKDAPEVGAPDDGGAGDSAVGGGDAEAVCARWSQVTGAVSEGAWTGDVATCDAGALGEAGREGALALVNLYRELASLPPVTRSGERDAAAQACALVMHANDALSHGPPQSWDCWSSLGSQAAGKSNLATTPAVAAVPLYMVDPGNATTLGHRRWILSNSLGPVGVGSTDAYSCLWVLSGSGQAGADWTAWPPPGPFPIQAAHLGWTSLDQTGWSLQSDSLDLSQAQVTVTSGGQPLPVTTTVLAANFGSKHALSFTPSGWVMQAGRAYDVVVTGAGATISYRVEVVDCAGA